MSRKNRKKLADGTVARVSEVHQGRTKQRKIALLPHLGEAATDDEVDESALLADLARLRDQGNRFRNGC
jgi:hypothetical protein